MDINEYQRRASETDEKKRSLVATYGLVGEVGSIFSTLKKRVLHSGSYPGFQQQLSEEIGDALWYLTNIATRHGLKLNDIAKNNIRKSEALFNPGRINYFDKKFPEDEQIPRSFEVHFSEKEKNKSVIVRVKMNGVIIGDSLTDNSYDPDGYRYHDVFHFAYAAVLGWSPVTRALLKRKRKSDPKKDEVEDGARAIAVEEALSIYIFNIAKRSGYFQEPGDIGLGLLNTVRDFVSELEPKVCTAKQWSKAIAAGYQVFKPLFDNKGGTVRVNLDNQTVEYVEHEPKSRKARG